ncbi:MAG: radical SAM protein, partial [Candidatus Latescibacterota bacterium]
MRGDDFFRQIAKKPPFTRMHPRLAGFFKEYLSNEKVIPFHGRQVMNTHFPPYPSRSFENLIEHFSHIGDARERRLFSVTLAVTNRCGYRCWHCYNAGRSQEDLPLSLWGEVISGLTDMGAVMVTLSGGEPLLRDDLEDIVGMFDERTTLKLNTTGAGLSPERAAALKEKGLFALGVSLDSRTPEIHDTMRGKKGAFRNALRALRIASENRLYPYVIAVATREFLETANFESYLRFISTETP